MRDGFITHKFAMVVLYYHVHAGDIVNCKRLSQYCEYVRSKSRVSSIIQIHVKFEMEESVGH